MIKKFNGKKPIIHNSTFIADDAVIIGDVKIGKQSSVWYKTVIRGDVNYIRIGDATNIQDSSVLHVTGDTHPLIVGNEVTVGHSVILHGCTVMDRVLVGMGSIVLDGAVLEENSFVAAGSVVSPGTIVPSGKLVKGIPAKVTRNLTRNEIKEIIASSEKYVINAANYMKDLK